MHRHFAIVGLAVALAASPSSAQRPEPTVAWHFFVKVGDGPTTDYNSQLDQVVTVTLPSDSPWRCYRNTVLAPLNGIASGKFNCSTDPSQSAVFIEAKCDARTQRQDTTRIMLFDQRRNVYVTASCSMI